MLYDASSLTSVTLKESKQRKGGLIYSHFYGSVKEMVDASKCKPFDNDALEEMALDPQLRRAARNIAGGHRREVQIVERAYTASKRRARAAILGSKRRSFGIREEHRIAWELFQQFKTLLEEQDRESLEIVIGDCPSYAWSVRTSIYLDFLWRSADKFATGFEVVHARSRHGMVSWEQTKMMFGFLRCCGTWGGHRIEPESAMWWSKRTTGEPGQQRSWYGLGLQYASTIQILLVGASSGLAAVVFQAERDELYAVWQRCPSWSGDATRCAGDRVLRSGAGARTGFVVVAGEYEQCVVGQAGKSAWADAANECHYSLYLQAVYCKD